jgi:hypothetical protein
VIESHQREAGPLYADLLDDYTIHQTCLPSSRYWSMIDSIKMFNSTQIASFVSTVVQGPKKRVNFSALTLCPDEAQ